MRQLARRNVHAHIVLALALQLPEVRAPASTPCEGDASVTQVLLASCSDLTSNLQALNSRHCRVDASSIAAEHARIVQAARKLARQHASMLRAAQQTAAAHIPLQTARVVCQTSARRTQTVPS
jgi:hypothetical protein